LLVLLHRSLLSSLLSTAPAPPPLSPLSLHDALPISPESRATLSSRPVPTSGALGNSNGTDCRCMFDPMSARFASSCSRNGISARSEEHTSELQSRRDLVCRLLLEKKKKKNQEPKNSE